MVGGLASRAQCWCNDCLTIFWSPRYAHFFGRTRMSISKPIDNWALYQQELYSTALLSQIYSLYIYKSKFFSVHRNIVGLCSWVPRATETKTNIRAVRNALFLQTFVLLGWSKPVDAHLDQMIWWCFDHKPNTWLVWPQFIYYKYLSTCDLTTLFIIMSSSNEAEPLMPSFEESNSVIRPKSHIFVHLHFSSRITATLAL